MKGFDIFRESMTLGNNNPNNTEENIKNNNKINSNIGNNNVKERHSMNINNNNNIDFIARTRNSIESRNSTTSISSHNHEIVEINQMAPKRRGAISDAPPSGSNDNIQPKSEEVHAQLENTLKENKIFAHLDIEERRELCNRMVMMKYSKNEEVIRQGEQGDNFYIIGKGECEIFVKDQTQKSKLVMVVGPQQCFGELALIYNSPRAATVKVSSDEVILYAIDRNTYRRTLMQEIIKKRKMYYQFLKGVPLLSSLMKYERLTVADALESCHFPAGHKILEQNQKGDTFYIVLEGKLRVTQKNESGEECEVGTLGVSDYFGEIALLTSSPRKATVTTITNVRCIKLDRKTFTRVMGPCDNILRRNMDHYKSYNDIIEENKRMKKEKKNLQDSNKRKRLDEKDK
eukprot:TRINITY_DN6300_c0_g1_i1.p1 TRINITY_DN6300_c0_g1~~TRINITY_DN6300_c0_g1_i1.p1  ORF type:complete len:452 (+),score=107.66 TRINITY_DN6300_c0_g1_i1:152-1357(+)